MSSFIKLYYNTDKIIITLSFTPSFTFVQVRIRG